MAEWDERAERWSQLQAQRSETFGPATERMLDLADLRTGNRVLDVAAGTGDQTLLAARRVGPNGYVLATDISTNMLNAAADAVRRAGLTKNILKHTGFAAVSHHVGNALVKVFFHR